MDKYKIAIIGAGNMGGAVARGLDSKKFDVVVSDPFEAQLAALKKSCPDITVTSNNLEAVKDADLVIMAVKPYVVEPVIEGIRDYINFERTVVASFAAPYTLEMLNGLLSKHDHMKDILSDTVIRPMIIKIIPNTAISVGKSMTFMSQLHVPDDRMKEVVDIFKTMGGVAEIPESQMPAATALCSCGLAYVMRFIRASVEGACELGIRPADALQYEINTLLGACQLLVSNGTNPEVEIDKVTTPGGITIKGLNAMEKYGFTNAVIEGLKASCPQKH